MTIWRMAMKCGDNGTSMYEECLALGVAAITYDGFAETDFTRIPENEGRQLMKPLAIARKSSLGRLCYEMKGGDVIYVKDGKEIIGKGVIRGKKGERAYRFNSAKTDLRDENETPWLQQVPVVWRPDFVPVRVTVGTNQRYAIQRISLEDARRIDNALDEELAVDAMPDTQDELLRTEAYFRASRAVMKVIQRKHNALSNEFAAWLKRKFSITTTRERGQVDVRFKLGGNDVLAELKVCYGGSIRHAIREALGQLLEYNHYPSRIPASEWLIVLDCEPDASDGRYIELLRSRRDLPVFLGWQSEGGFQFSPGWPD